MQRPSLRPFTPSREDPAVLDRRTVGRDLLIGSIERRLLAAATTKNRCHTLVVGPRGSGKTHVLDVALHRLRTDPRQRGGLVVARVGEDAVGVVTYPDLVLHIYESLGLPPDVGRRARARRDVIAIEAAITDHLAGRALVVAVENLSRVFESLGKSGQQDFRSFVETSGDILLLASTPLLFKGVISRSEPWFGSFAIEHLSELTLDEGIELLRRLAVEDGDEPLARFILEPRGRARLAALHHLAGGSPRLWMILAGCASVELLDELVPAVEELLENLVAYYQQRLWELPGNEQKLVRELGSGPAAASVGDLAARSGLEERTAATALGRLADAGWVRSEKVPGTDQRRSWYRLREPLLRHHLQYRQADGAPLRLVVDVLRLWFDPLERRTRLAAVQPSSTAERHLLATLPLDPPQRSDAAFAGRDVDRLLGEARCWISDPQAMGSPEAGMLLEAAILAVKDSADAGRAALEDRDAPPAVRRRAAHVFSVAEVLSPGEPLDARAGAVLDAAADASRSGRDHALLELVAASWNGFSAPTRAVERLEALLEVRRPARLTMTIRDEHAFWVGFAGRHDEAVAALSAVLEHRLRVLGPDHPDTLSTRRSLGDELGRAGRHDEAIEVLAAVAEDRARILGPDHPDTLSTRRSLGLHLGMAGRDEEMITTLTAAADEGIRRFGPEHVQSHTLRNFLVPELIRLGRHHEAVRLAVETLDHAARFESLHPALEASRATLSRALFEILESGGQIPTLETEPSPPAREVFELMRELEAARDGSGEAEVGLPSELRPLVQQLKEAPAR